MNCFLNFDNYWHPNYKGIAGYATLPTSAEKVPDRFYDENGWTAIGLCDAYLATQNNSYLEKAKGALAFSLSEKIMCWRRNLFPGNFCFFTRTEEYDLLCRNHAELYETL